MSDRFCRRQRAAVNLRGQNGRRHYTRPKVRSRCGKRKRRAKRSSVKDRGGAKGMRRAARR